MQRCHTILGENQCKTLHNVINGKKRADRFAAFCLAAFRPETKSYDKDNRDPQLRYDWESLQSWLQDLRKYRSFISQARIDLLHKTVFGMTTNSKARTALGKYRRRSADYWIDEPWAKRIKSGVRKQIENYRIIDTNNNFSDLSDMMEVQTLSTQELRAAMEGSNYSVFITKNLQKMSTKSNTLLETRQHIKGFSQPADKLPKS